MQAVQLSKDSESGVFEQSHVQSIVMLGAVFLNAFCLNFATLCGLGECLPDSVCETDTIHVSLRRISAHLKVCAPSHMHKKSLIVQSCILLFHWAPLWACVHACSFTAAGVYEMHTYTCVYFFFFFMNFWLKAKWIYYHLLLAKYSSQLLWLDILVVCNIPFHCYSICVQNILRI